LRRHRDLGKNGIRAVFRALLAGGSVGEKKDGERVAVGVSICYYYSHGPVLYIRLVMPI
jgi:hypothetical protein